MSTSHTRMWFGSNIHRCNVTVGAVPPPIHSSKRSCGRDVGREQGVVGEAAQQRVQQQHEVERQPVAHEATTEAPEVAEAGDEDGAGHPQQQVVGEERDAGAGDVRGEQDQVDDPPSAHPEVAALRASQPRSSGCRASEPGRRVAPRFESPASGSSCPRRKMTAGAGDRQLPQAVHAPYCPPWPSPRHPRRPDAASQWSLLEPGQRDLPRLRAMAGVVRLPHVRRARLRRRRRDRARPATTCVSTPSTRRSPSSPPPCRRWPPARSSLAARRGITPDEQQLQRPVPRREPARRTAATSHVPRPAAAAARGGGDRLAALPTRRTPVGSAGRSRRRPRLVGQPAHARTRPHRRHRPAVHADDGAGGARPHALPGAVPARPRTHPRPARSGPRVRPRRAHQEHGVAAVRPGARHDRGLGLAGPSLAHPARRRGRRRRRVADHLGRRTPSIDPGSLLPAGVLPHQYMEGLHYLSTHDTVSGPGYLLGSAWNGGRWWYWPGALLGEDGAAHAAGMVVGPFGLAHVDRPVRWRGRRGDRHPRDRGDGGHRARPARHRGALPVARHRALARRRRRGDPPAAPPSRTDRRRRRSSRAAPSWP